MCSKIVTSLVWLHVFIWLDRRHDQLDYVCPFKFRGSHYSLSEIQLSLHDAEMRASWVLINVLQVWRKNPRISVWRHIKEYEPELRWSNFHLDFLFDAKEFLNCSLLSNAFVGLLEMVHTGELRDKVALTLTTNQSSTHPMICSTKIITGWQF